MDRPSYYLVRACLTGTTGAVALAKLLWNVPHLILWWENNVMLCSLLGWEAAFHPVAFDGLTWAHHVCMIIAMLVDNNNTVLPVQRNLAAALEFAGGVYNAYAYAKEKHGAQKAKLKRLFKPAMLFVTGLRLCLLSLIFFFFARRVHPDDKLCTFSVFCSCITIVMVAVDIVWAKNICTKF